MGNRTRDRVIYIRTDEKLQAEFEKQKEASGYGSNADFVDYLLRVSEGKQADGVTLKDVRNLLSELSAELKKQGVNINQIAKILNTYGSMDMKQLSAPMIKCKKTPKKKCRFMTERWKKR